MKYADAIENVASRYWYINDLQNPKQLVDRVTRQLKSIKSQKRSEEQMFRDNLLGCLAECVLQENGLQWCDDKYLDLYDDAGKIVEVKTCPKIGHHFCLTNRYGVKNFATYIHDKLECRELNKQQHVFDYITIFYHELEGSDLMIPKTLESVDVSKIRIRFVGTMTRDSNLTTIYDD